MTKTNRAWHTRDGKVVASVHSYFLNTQEQRKIDEQSEDNMVKINLYGPFNKACHEFDP